MSAPVCTRLWATPVPDNAANGPREPGGVAVQLPARWDLFVQASLRFVRATRTGVEQDRTLAFLEMTAAYRELETTGETVRAR